MAQEMHDLIGGRAGIDHCGVGDGQGQVIRLAGAMGGRDADLAIIGRAKDAVGQQAAPWPVAGDDAQGIIDLAQRALGGGVAAGAKQAAGLVQDQRMEAQPIGEIGDLAAAVGRAEHDGAAQMVGTMAREPGAQHQATHRMADAMDDRRGKGRAGGDAGVEMVDHAGERPAPTGIADIGDGVARAAQAAGEQGGLHRMAAKAVEEDDGFCVCRHDGRGVMPTRCRQVHAGGWKGG